MYLKPEGGNEQIYKHRHECSCADKSKLIVHLRYEQRIQYRERITEEVCKNGLGRKNIFSHTAGVPRHGVRVAVHKIQPCPQRETNQIRESRNRKCGSYNSLQTWFHPFIQCVGGAKLRIFRKE